MPPHSLYVEPFAGSAQVFFRKVPARFNVLIDANAGVHAKLDVACRQIASDSVSVDVIHDDAWRWLRWNFDNRRDALIYCDPTYMLATRTKQRLYGPHEMTDDEHALLLSTLVRLNCFVMISGYPSPLYSSRLQNWRCCSYRTRTRGRTVTECLWMNFPEPGELHDWRYAGQNHRERTSLKRLAARYLARLDAMSPRKRGYILNAIGARQNWQARPQLRPETPILT